MTSTLQKLKSTNVSFSNIDCSITDFYSDDTLENLSMLEAYQFGQRTGQKEYYLFNTDQKLKNQTSLLDQLSALIDWWSRSNYIEYGTLTLSDEQKYARLVTLEMNLKSNHSKKMQEHQLNLAFFAGVISGFISFIANHDVEVIAHSGTQPQKLCKILLGGKDALKPIPFWETVDRISTITSI